MLKTVLKNKLKGIFLASAIAFTASPTMAYAQISIDNIAPAAVYEAGVLDATQGGLASDLWQGMDAKSATRLLKQVKPNPTGMAKTLLKSVLYSGGVPPQYKDQSDYRAWQSERLHAVLKLSDIKTFDELVSKSAISSDDPAFAKLFVRRALVAGQVEQACQIGDKNTAERSSSYWMKLRAFCHAIRGEMPAAETTADMLIRAGEKDKDYFTLLNGLGGLKINLSKIKPNTALKIAMLREVMKKQAVVSLANISTLPPILAAEIAKDNQAKPEFRLAGLFNSASILSPEQISQILDSLSDNGGLDEKPLSKAELAAQKWSPKLWGQVWDKINNNRDMEELSALSATMLKQAKKRGVFDEMGKSLSSILAFIPIDQQAKYPEIFAEIHVKNNDLAALRALYLSLDEKSKWRGRIALASDALGGGFNFGELGVDIESRLQDKKTKNRAIRDVYIATALGAKLSPSAEDVLLKNSLTGKTVHPAQLLALSQAVDNRSTAGSLLRVGQIFTDIKPENMRSDDLAVILKALGAIGQTKLAAQIAAQDFIGVFEK